MDPEADNEYAVQWPSLADTTEKEAVLKEVAKITPGFKVLMESPDLSIQQPSTSGMQKEKGLKRKSNDCADSDSPQPSKKPRQTSPINNEKPVDNYTKYLLDQEKKGKKKKDARHKRDGRK